LIDWCNEAMSNDRISAYFSNRKAARRASDYAASMSPRTELALADVVQYADETKTKQVL
jgi:hypothetical protein